MLIKFLENKQYNHITFLKGEVYDFGNDTNFATRWIKRGCLVVDKASKVNPDPRFPLDVKLEVPQVEEPVIDFPGIFEAEIDEETIDEETKSEETIEQEVKPKRNLKSRR